MSARAKSHGGFEMATSSINRVIQNIGRAVLIQNGAGLTDAELLSCFIDKRDEAAFEALLRRHGPMVLGVCRRVLRNHHDAEDAFQAAFLVLVRKAATIVPRTMVGNWLYGVAHTTALRARVATARRRADENQAMRVRQHEAVSQEEMDDLQGALFHELSCLPEKYRLPIVVCDLEGTTIKEAARN